MSVYIAQKCSMLEISIPAYAAPFVFRNIVLGRKRTQKQLNTMGWLDSVFGSKSADDPIQKLDPKLRDFLEKESPVKFQPNRTPADVETSQRSPAPEKPRQDAQSGVPSASLYQDGRYADLWKTYKPLESVEADTKSSHEKLMDVLDGYKERKMVIAKAALENCSFQQEEWRRCMVEGSWVDTLQMCRDKVKKFERCYSMQSV